MLSLANSGDFGACCRGAHVDEPLLIANSGDCKLTIEAINSSDASFVVPEVLHFPLTVEPAGGLSVILRFAPHALGAANATITVISDDPASPATITVKGNAPAGKLTVAGSATFNGVKCCKREQRRLEICNTGECVLYVHRVALRLHHKHFRIVNNPFPAHLQPGSCLDLVVEYHAVQRAGKPCELIIESDDPHEPIKCVDVIAWTEWDCCEERECDCRKEKRECCCKCKKRCSDDHCGDDDDEKREDGEEGQDRQRRV